MAGGAFALGIIVNRPCQRNQSDAFQARSLISLCC
jgi:hypothetical protein